MADKKNSVLELSETDNRGKFIKILFVIAGTIFLLLGAIGILLPVVPTTPFLLLSAACYYKGSKRSHNWILNNKWFGHYIKNYTEGKGISLKAKIFTISLLWLTILYSIIFVINILIVQLILFIIAIGVSIHIITITTYKKKI